MSISITWHGHSNFQIAANGVNLLIDPFFGSTADTTWDKIPDPDLVLITHDHGDHVGDVVNICKKSGAKCACMVGTGVSLIKSGVPAKQMFQGIGFNPGGSVEVKGVKVIMTQAFHPSDSGMAAGYIIILPGGFTIYHAGDTAIFQSMALLGEIYPIDVAMLPVGGFFTMDGYQAAHAARLLKAKAAIPMHWGTFPMIAATPEEFEKNLKKFAPTCRCVTMRSGETQNF